MYKYCTIVFLLCFSSFHAMFSSEAQSHLSEGDISSVSSGSHGDLSEEDLSELRKQDGWQGFCWQNTRNQSCALVISNMLSSNAQVNNFPVSHQRETLNGRHSLIVYPDSFDMYTPDSETYHELIKEFSDYQNSRRGF